MKIYVEEDEIWEIHDSLALLELIQSLISDFEIGGHISERISGEILCNIDEYNESVSRLIKYLEKAESSIDSLELDFV
jgi:hypothetical protein